MRRMATEIARLIEEAFQDFLKAGLPADRLINQAPSSALPPAGNTGSGYTPAPHAAEHESGGDDEIDLGSLAGELTDGQHGDRGGGNLHSVATTSVAGFQSAADKAKSDAYPVLSGLTPGYVFTALGPSTAHFQPVQGDMLKSTYDPDLDGKVTSAVTADKVIDGDKGDITVSGSGTVWTIDNDVVTYAKIQNVSATDKLLGRSSAGAGDIEEITCTAAGRALIDDTTAAAQRTTLGLGAAALLATPIPLASGGTNADLSATGGAGQVVKQSSTGAALSVAALVASDIPVATTAAVGGIIVGHDLAIASSTLNLNKGTSFPGSPASGDEYFRTDLGLRCYYDGTRWLTINDYSVSLIYTTFSTTPSDVYLFEIRQDYAPYITRASMTTRVATTNNGTNFWSVTVKGHNLSFGAATTIHSFTTAADTVNVFTLHDSGTMSGTATPSNHNHLGITIAKTLSPGILEIMATIYYKLIVT